MMKTIPLKTVEETVTGLLNVIDKGTREKEGGAFISYDGRRLE
jgi:hypothetical protein